MIHLRDEGGWQWYPAEPCPLESVAKLLLCDGEGLRILGCSLQLHATWAYSVTSLTLDDD